MYKDIPQDLLQIVEPVVRGHGLELVAAPRLAGGGPGGMSAPHPEGGPRAAGGRGPGTARGRGPRTVRGGVRLRVIVDTPEGDGRVDVEACARLSRELGHTLDALGPSGGFSLLEVTSPGVDRTLGREVDFERAVGRRVQVETDAPLGGRRRFKGELSAFAGSSARIETDSGPVEVPFARIARARALHPGTPGRGR
ncbi:MAG: ribosome maturation factor RimP [Myxococcota bacterium]